MQATCVTLVDDIPFHEANSRDSDGKNGLTAPSRLQPLVCKMGVFTEGSLCCVGL